MGWIPYPTAYQTNWPQARQDQAASPALPYTAAQLNNSAIPQSIRDQMQAAQQLQSVATSTAPHSSGLVNGLQALAGYIGGRQEAQADAAVAPYQQGSTQPSSGLLAQILRGGSPVSTDDTSPPATGWGAVGQGVGQAAQSIGRKSDRRLKSDVTRIGVLPNGLAVYRYRLEGGAPEIGLMAQEVLSLHPGAVWEAEDGFLRVDYSKAVL